MREIEKMYEKANLIDFYCDDDYFAEHMSGFFECTGGDKEKCKTCNKAKISYPPFTAEKQLELIKWLAEHSDFGSFSPDVDIDKDTKVKTYGFAFVKRGEKHYYVDDKFETALAKCFKSLWQDLTKKERKQIKEILE